MSDPTPTSLRLHTLSLHYESWSANATGNGFVSSSPNNLGYPIFAAGIVVWIGEQGGAITDTPFSIVNVTQNDPLCALGWDHYAPPTSINGNTCERFWGPSYYLIMPNDVICFSVSATSYNGPEFVSAGGSLRYYK